MTYKKNIRIHIWDFGILILNFLYFIPKTIAWLRWDSGVTMGYVGIELIVNYFIHIFFINSCISLLRILNKNYSLYSLFIIMSIYFVSFIFAFRIIEFIVFVPFLIYIYVFYRLLKKIGVREYSEESISALGFVISIIWLVLDQKLFG